MKAAPQFRECGGEMLFYMPLQTHLPRSKDCLKKDLCGHGVGLKFHEDPLVCHYRTKHPTMIMVPGMVFTVEPMINQGTWRGHTLADNWTFVTEDKKLSAQWEHTVAVTEDGYEILT